MENLEIMFEDLNQEAKAKVLDFYDITFPEQLNFDVFPLAVLNAVEKTEE